MRFQRCGLSRAAAGVTLALCWATVAGIASATAAGNRHAAMVIDANTGAVLHQVDADAPRYPASLTKMMTLYVVFDLIEQGRLSHQTRITVSETAADVQPTKLGIKAGRDIALIDAMKSLVTKSANDMSVAIAEHIAGSEEKFAALMTQRARLIGMAATTFKNAHGLPDSGQVTTARDMLTLALRLQDDFPKQYPIFALKSFSYGQETMRNHNTLLFQLQGIDGIKTGYTSPSGFNLVSSYRLGSKHVVAAVFGGSSASARNQEMRQILTRALTKASTVKTRTPAPMLVARATRPPRFARVVALDAPAEPAPRPILVERPAVAVAREQTVALAEPVATPAPKRPSIEVARVRPVLVAPRAPLQTPTVPEAVVAEPARAPAAPSPPPAETIADRALRTPSFRDMPAERAEAATAPAEAAGPPAQVPFAERALTLAAHTPEAQRAPEPIAAPKPARSIVRMQSAAAPVQAAAQPARGAQPSTFQQQAAALAAPQPVRPPAPERNGGGQLQIQIGAFSSQPEAERQLGLARQRAGGLLDAYRPLTVPVQTEGRQIFRARYAGVEATGATTLCTELRRRQIDCLVARE